MTLPTKTLTRLQGLRGISFLSSLVLLLAGCGGGGSQTEAAPPVLTYALSVTNNSGAGQVVSAPSGISCANSDSTSSASNVCSASYAADSQITLTATPNTGYTFSGWSGCSSSSSNTCAVSLGAAASVGASFTPDPASTYTLNVTNSSGLGQVDSLPSGISCTNSGSASSASNACSASYTAGTQITLTANPTAGNTFSGWSGACDTISSNVCVLSLNAAASVSANFVQAPATTYALSVTNSTGFGKVVSLPSGISCVNSGSASSASNACSASYTAGTQITLTATPNTGYTFSSWTGACDTISSNVCMLSLNAAASVSASFVPVTATTYLLSVTNSSGLGQVASSPSGISCTNSSSASSASNACGASFTAGSQITLTATPTAGNTFSGWSGACSSSASSTCTLSLSAATSVGANFTPTSSGSGYMLSVNNSSGLGQVVSSPSGISCTNSGLASSASNVCSASFPAGTQVILTETPNTGSTFTGWTGSCTQGSPTATAGCTVPLTAATTINAGFILTSGTSIASCAKNASSTVYNLTAANMSAMYSYKQYGNYLVQVNAYGGMDPQVSSFSLWTNASSCWGFSQPEPKQGGFWNSPESTYGWTMNSGAVTQLGGSLSTWTTSHGLGIQVGSLTKAHVKWAMTVPSVVNTASSTTSIWDALLDVYFHPTANPGAYGVDVSGDVAIDLQIYQMVMDYQAGGNPNWYAYIVSNAHPFTKTISGVTYYGGVNNQDPYTEGTGTWKCNGGKEMQIALFVVPTPGSGSGSYLWGSKSVVHDLGAIIKWLNQSNPTDDSGAALYDNCGGSSRTGATVTSPLIPSTMYLTSINGGYEVNQAPASNASFSTTDFWVSVQGGTDGSTGDSR